MGNLEKALRELQNENGGAISVYITNGFKCHGKLIEVGDGFIKLKDQEGKKKIILLSAISTFE